jgi:hypothetical protein
MTKIIIFLLNFYFSSGLHAKWTRIVRNRKERNNNFVVPGRTLEEILKTIKEKSYSFYKKDSLGVFFDWIPSAKYFEKAIQTNKPYEKDCDCGAFASWIYDSLEDEQSLGRHLLMVCWREKGVLKAHYLCVFNDHQSLYYAVSNWGLTGPCESYKELLLKITSNNPPLTVWKILPKSLHYIKQNL